MLSEIRTKQTGESQKPEGAEERQTQRETMTESDEGREPELQGSSITHAVTQVADLGLARVRHLKHFLLQQSLQGKNTRDQAKEISETLHEET
jgi:hypothetical protein